jgi:hypothetical protein
MLNCQGDRHEIDDYENLVCKDKETGAKLAATDQLKNYLLTQDHRLAKIKPQFVLNQLIEMSPSDAKLLQMVDFDTTKRPEWRASSAAALAAPSKEQPKINGIYYDTRLKSHNFSGQRQAVLVFTNVSAEKELQRKQTKLDIQ